jgi:MFS family permease
MITIGYALNTLFTFAYLLVSNTTELLLVQVGLGIAEAVSTPSWDAYYASQLLRQRQHRRHLLLGHRQRAHAVHLGCGRSRSAGLIANFVSFQALFVTMGVLNLLATLVQARVTWLDERVPA